VLEKVNCFVTLLLSLVQLQFQYQDDVPFVTFLQVQFYFVELVAQVKVLVALVELDEFDGVS